MAVSRVTGGTKSTSNSGGSSGGSIFAARVTAIILDDTTHADAFKAQGNWGSIGTIYWAKTDVLAKNNVALENNYAKPLFPNDKKYPLINEVVYLISLPNANNESKPQQSNYYYFQPINIWGSAHHNAIPQAFTNTTPESQQNTNQQVEAGAP
ncbi:MAG: hypothetical protein HN660_00705, partial [Flavobacteriaceae bacterium]|nr:hypothetical protein [Flavobacteriaceae bacterium]